MIQLSSRPTQEVIVRGSGKVEVLTKPRAEIVRVVQTVSPVPTSAGEVADPGDLTLIFDNKVI